MKTFIYKHERDELTIRTQSIEKSKEILKNQVYEPNKWKLKE